MALEKSTHLFDNQNNKQITYIQTIRFNHLKVSQLPFVLLSIFDKK